MPGRYKLHQLHRAFQLLFWWEDYHLHMFRIRGRRYGHPEHFEDDDDYKDVLDERGTCARRPRSHTDVLQDLQMLRGEASYFLSESVACRSDMACRKAACFT